MNKPVIPVPEDLSLDGDDERRSFRVEAAGESTVIELYDDVFPWEAKRMLGEIRAAKGRSLTMRINSMGGDVFGGVAVYNALARHGGRVEVEVEGVAASIASIIAMGGGRVRMGKGAWMMIHEPHAVVAGRAGDMKATADLLDKIRDSMADIYAQKSGMDRAKILEMMAAETWLSADEAVEFGFADGLNGQAKLAARAAPGRFRNPPAELLARANDGLPTLSPDEIKAALAEINDEKILRAMASHIGTLLRPFAASAKADDPGGAPEKPPPPDVPPAAAADAPKADTTPPETPVDPLVREATQARIRKALEAAKAVTV